MSPDHLLSDAALRGDWGAVADVIAEHWVELKRSHKDVFDRVVTAVPPAELETNPHLALARSSIDPTFLGGPLGVTRYDRPRVVPEALVDVLAHLTARSVRGRMSGNHDDATRAADEGRQTLDDATSEARLSVATVLPDIEVQWGLSYLIAGLLDRALATFTDAFDNAFATGNTRMAADAAGNAALILAYRGAGRDARAWLTRVPRVADEADSAFEAGRIAAGVLAVDALDREEAESVIAGFASSGEAEHWAFRLYVEARAAVTWDEDTTVALARLTGDVAGRRVGGRTVGVNGTLLAHAEAALRLRAGDIPRARAALDRIRLAVPEELLDAQAIMEARVAAASGSVSEAVEKVNAVLSRDPLPREAATARLVRGALFEDAADMAAARLLMDAFGLHSLAGLVPRVAWDALAGGVGPREQGLRFAPTYSEGRTDLTRRERSVLRAILAGRTVADVAAEQRLSPNTIKKQLLSAYRRLGVDNRVDAAREVRLRPWLLSEPTERRGAR